MAIPRMHRSLLSTRYAVAPRPTSGGAPQSLTRTLAGPVGVHVRTLASERYHRHIRHLSTSPSPQEPPTQSPTPRAERTWPLTFLLILSGAGLGAYLAHQYSELTFEGRKWNPLTSRTFRTSTESRVAGLNNLYGSSEDFATAIKKLREAFPEKEGELQKVSTEEDDLETHGFSENDYHPGTCSVFC